jgi:AraC-like DNA-binding protein
MFHEYLLALRVKEAMRLLSETDLSIQDICRKIGYSTASHFIKIFKAYTGMTPTKYRGGGGGINYNYGAGILWGICQSVF